MDMITDDELINKAKEVAKVHRSSELVTMGYVGCALITDKGSLYVGICIDACCGIGFCAEHNAISSMVTYQEYLIKKIVAVSCEGKILPPCGRCREFMYQIDERNYEQTEIILGKDKKVKLKDLLPDCWQEKI